MINFCKYNKKTGEIVASGFTDRAALDYMKSNETDHTFKECDLVYPLAQYVKDGELLFRPENTANLVGEQFSVGDTITITDLIQGSTISINGKVDIDNTIGTTHTISAKYKTSLRIEVDSFPYTRASFICEII